MHINNDVATLEVNSVPGYRITVAIQREDGEVIANDEAERALTQAKGEIFQVQSWQLGGK